MKSARSGSKNMTILIDTNFEDSLQSAVGEGLPVDYIITRNTQDFSSSSIKAVTPKQFLRAVADIKINN